ncbi:MAG: hypothetical protein HKM93_05125 [Desulfobacteraceae bacterium]|nr:hypothetical protein [Desulfobacteraceae bacterium]
MNRAQQLTMRVGIIVIATIWLAGTSMGEVYHHAGEAHDAPAKKPAISTVDSGINITFMGTRDTPTKLDMLPNVNVANVDIKFGGIANFNIATKFINSEGPGDAIYPYPELEGLGNYNLNAFNEGLSSQPWLTFDANDFYNENYEFLETGIGFHEDDSRFEPDVLDIEINGYYTLPFVEVVQADVGFTIQNIPKLRMGEKDDFKENTGFGMAVKKSFSKFSLMGAIEHFNYIEPQDNDDALSKKIKMGIVFQLPSLLSVRAGIDRGYPGFGFTLDTWLIRFDFSAYGNGSGDNPDNKMNEHYIGQFTLDW